MKKNKKHEINVEEKIKKNASHSLIKEQEIDLIKFFLLFKNEWKAISFIVGFFLIIGLIYALLATPWYKAEVKIMPSIGQGVHGLRQYSNIAALAGINLGGEVYSNYYLYPEIIKSNFILDRILRKKFKNITYNKPKPIIKFLDVKIDSTKNNWQYKLNVKAKKILKKEYIKSFLNVETDLLVIQVTVPKDPVLAAELANYIVEQLDNYNKNFRHYKAKDKRKFIEKSLEETEQNLIFAENTLKEFLNKNKDLTSPETKLEYEKLYNELNLQRAIYTELKKQLELAKIEEVNETETLNILDKAEVPTEKYKPKRSFIMVIALIISIFISITFVVLKNYYLNVRNEYIVNEKSK